MNSESPPQPPQEDELAPRQEQAALEVKKLGMLERAKIARDMLIKPVLANGLNKMREVDVRALMDTAASAASSGKDHIINAAVGAGMMTLEVTGLGEAADAGTIVGTSHELVGGIGSTLSMLGKKGAGSLFTKTAGFMKRHPGMVRSAEELAQRKIVEFRTKNG